jgi:HTH-type transcriptional regulator, sugar sensing transcriptional regulator
MNIKQLLKLFNLREIEIQIYESLFYQGMMSATQIAKQVGLSRTSVYDLLDKLIEVGLISEIIKTEMKMFAVLPPEKLEILIAEKQKKIKNAQETIKQLKLVYDEQEKTAKPNIKIFEGKKELQQMMKDLLLYRDITIYAFWPIKKITHLLGKDFLKEFNQKRIERNIKIKVIWPQKQLPNFKQFPFLKNNDKFIRQARIAPAQINFSLGYTIYGNTVRFLSSSKENYGFLVESNELAEMMKNQFDLIWSISKKFK